MAQLNTRIILRNDSTINWESSKDQILLKGEIGIEFLNDGSTKLKIGDGVKSWAQLDYFGGEFDTTTIDDLETRLNTLEDLVGQDGEIPTGIFETLSNFRTQILNLNNDVETLEEVIGTPAGEQTPATGIFADRERLSNVEQEIVDLITGLSSKANSEDVYTKDEVYTKVEVIAQIDKAEHLKRKIFATIDEAESFILSNYLIADQYVYMIPTENEVDGNKYDEYLVIDGILERVGDWAVDLTDYAKAKDLEDLETQVGTLIDEIVKQDDLVLLLADKADKSELQSYAKLTDIENFVTSEQVNDLATLLNNKVDKNGTDRLITEEEVKKLEKLVISEDGSVGISGTINAANVKELYDNVVRIVTGTGSYNYDGSLKELLGIERGAEVNLIEQITLAGGDPLVINDKTVNIPLAIEGAAGLVVSSNEDNKISVAADGTMEINKLNVNKLVQEEGDYLILNGGNSSAEY